MILIVSLIEFRDDDYLLSKQVLSQTEQRMDWVQRSPSETFTRIPRNSVNRDARSHSVQERAFSKQLER